MKNQQAHLFFIQAIANTKKTKELVYNKDIIINTNDMKKIITLFLLLLTSFINAQNYVPMAIENAQWIIYVEDEDGYPPFTDYYYGYRIEGDININGIDYKKVYCRIFAPINIDTNNPIVKPLIIENEFFFGVIRDDIPNKRVYGIKFCNDQYFEYGTGYCNCDEEYLMYDFNMNLNDYYTDYCYFGGESGAGDQFHLGEIVYQNIANENRQVQKIYDSLGDTILIRNFEGIGSTFGLFEPICYFECNFSHILDFYCVGRDEECLNDYILSTNNQIFNNSINIFPNPASDKITIELKIKREYNIEIFNLYGKKIISKQINSDNITLDISKFSIGVYILRINKQHTYKLIKQ